MAQRRCRTRLGWRTGNGILRCLRGFRSSVGLFLFLHILLDIVVTFRALSFGAAVGSVSFLAHDVVLRGRERRHDEQTRLTSTVPPDREVASPALVIFRF